MMDDPADEEIAALLRQLQRLIVRYPFAAQPLYSALLSEGRQFAATAEGQVWQARLAQSAMMQKARVVWDVTTLNVLEDDPNAIVPSKLLEAFVSASTKPDFERRLATLLHDLFSADGVERSANLG
jgi:hypothetical protein